MNSLSGHNNSYLSYQWGKRAISNECEVCNTSRRRVLQSHGLTIACSPRVKHVIFPNTSSDNCTFTVCFTNGKMAIFLTSEENSNNCEISHFPVSKQTVKVQFSLDVLGKTIFEANIYFIRPGKHFFHPCKQFD